MGTLPVHVETMTWARKAARDLNGAEWENTGSGVCSRHHAASETERIKGLVAGSSRCSHLSDSWWKTCSGRSALVFIRTCGDKMLFIDSLVL